VSSRLHSLSSIRNACAQIEPGQRQFIEKNFDAYIEQGDREARLRQIHTWLFLERKPIAAVRQLLAAAVHHARVLAVTSGKGGVGKTTVSVNIAVALAQQRRRVLVFDADLGMANAHIFAGIMPHHTLLDVLEGRATLKEAVAEGPSGIHVICGASGIQWLADLEAGRLDALCRDLRAMADAYDFLILDTGAGVSAQVMRFLGMADDILVVTTPNLAATLDAYGIVKSVHETGLNGNVRLLVNQAHDELEAAKVAKRIADCATRFLGTGPSLLGFLTHDPAVEIANQARRPLLHQSPANENAGRLRELSGNLYAKPDEAASKAPSAL